MNREKYAAGDNAARPMGNHDKFFIPLPEPRRGDKVVNIAPIYTPHGVFLPGHEFMFSGVYDNLGTVMCIVEPLVDGELISDVQGKAMRNISSVCCFEILEKGWFERYRNAKK